MEIDNLIEYLFSRQAKNLPAEALADIFDRLIWCMDDNGKEISDTLKEWLEGNDPRRIKIALTVQTIFPYHTREEMNIVFKNIVQKWPQFQKRCQEILDQWDNQFRPNSLILNRCNRP